VIVRCKAGVFWPGHQPKASAGTRAFGSLTLRVGVIAACLTTLSISQGQERPAPPAAVSQSKPVQAAPAAQRPGRDLGKWPFLQKQIFLAAQRGSEWLQRANQRDGRFVPGYVPALRVTLEGDSYLRQIGAALALARAAGYFSDERAAAIARQAVLTLLEDTGPEGPNSPSVRVCKLPAGMVNPQGAAAALVQAIHELPAPAGDLLDQADQLCNGLRRTQRADGSISCSDSERDAKVSAHDIEAMNQYSGEVLHALMLSQQHRPAAWKLEIVRKALPFYQAHWRANKGLVLVPRHTAAYAEAFLQTNDKALADFIFEMNDWLCTFQYQQLDPQHPLWIGGFMNCVDGKPGQAPPQAISAAWAESLVEAARVARRVGDVARWERYKLSLERSMQFLMTLQYTEANSQHFAEWYRPVVLGSFHGSHMDGNIRLDYTQQAVCAMIAYLTHVAEVP
jgi:hypothetical protein